MTTNSTGQNSGLLWKFLGFGLLGQVLLALVVFYPAGTVRYWQGWAFMAVMSLHNFFLLYFYKHQPQLLGRRLLRKETLFAQKIVLILLKYVTGSTVALSALDFRLGWSRQLIAPVPVWLTVLALLVIVVCQVLIFRVMQSNAFAASVIRIEDGQTIAEDGPYRRVRHPMYAVWCVQWLFVPLGLGSFVALPIGALVTPVFVWRLLNEENLLRRDLPGYAEYCERTKERLAPYVW